MSGHVQRLPTGKYQARYTGPDGRERAKNFTRKGDAQRHLDAATTAVSTGSFVAPERTRITVGKLASLWLESKPSWSPTTRARNAGVVRTHIVPRWGQAPIRALDPLSIQAWAAQLTASGQSPASVHKILSALSGICELARKDRRMVANPITDVDKPRVRSAPRRYLTAEQVHHLAQAAGPGQVPTLVLAYCGLRWAELSGLRVGDFDPLRRRLMIEQTAVELDNGTIEIREPKDYERRSVPVPGFVVEAIALELASRSNPPRESLLLPSPEGAYLRNRNARRAWFDPAALAIGEPTLTPHALRHTAASLAISAGASVLAVSRMLGHARPSITLDVYADLFDSDLDEVAERLDKMGRSAAESGRVTDSRRIRSLPRP